MAYVRSKTFFDVRYHCNRTCFDGKLSSVMRWLFILLLLASFCFTKTAYGMASLNYSIDWDSINTGGNESGTSLNYKINDTVGEQGAGSLDGVTYNGLVGYQQVGAAAAAVVTPPVTGGGAGDTAAPIISEVLVSDITLTAATITWSTNESSNSTVDYGTTLAYGSQTADPGYVTVHQIVLSGLSPNTVYFFQVSSRDSASNTASSGGFTFTTASVQSPAPVISNVQVINITETSALVTWNTDLLADSKVDFGTTGAYGSVISDPVFVQTHALPLNGLTPGSAHHFSITSVDQLGASASTLDAEFITLADITPPINISEFNAVGGDAIVNIFWTLPADPTLVGVRIVRGLGFYPSGPNDGTVIYDGMLSSIVDSDVINGTNYYYGAFAYDANGNFSSGALASAATLGAIVPPLPLPEPTPTPAPAPTPEPVPQPGSGLIPDQAVPSAGGAIITISPKFFISNGTIELQPDSSNQFGTLSGAAVLVTVPVTNLGSKPVEAFVLVGDSIYRLTYNEGAGTYSGTFIAPPPGTSVVTVSMSFEDGAAAVSKYSLLTQSGGIVVVEGVVSATQTGVAEAEVTLYVKEGGIWTLWDGASYGQQNPQLTTSDGSYSFVVPNGYYFVEVKRDGFISNITPPRLIQKNVYSERVQLLKAPESIKEAFDPNASVLANIENLSGALLSQGLYGTTVLRKLVQTPEIQKATVVSSPVLLGVALLNVGSALPLVNVFSYLQFLFTQPLLILGLKKRKKWGIVYNALTKQPVELAIVRLKLASTGQVVQTKVTDKFGRYSFVVKAEKYILEVAKPGYAYPSAYLGDKQEDIEYVDLYHGEEIEVLPGMVLARNIPLDPTLAEEAPKKVLWKHSMQILRQNFAALTLSLSLVAILIVPSIQSIAIFLAQVLAYLLFRKLGAPRKAKSWGAVLDSESLKPIDRVVVRIFDKKFNKMLETQVTAAHGKYGFFVRRNVYYVTAEKEGYEKYVSPEVDLIEKDEALIDQNIVLKKISLTTTPQFVIQTESAGTLVPTHDQSVIQAQTAEPSSPATAGLTGTREPVPAVNQNNAFIRTASSVLAAAAERNSPIILARIKTLKQGAFKFVHRLSTSFFAKFFKNRP